MPIFLSVIFGQVCYLSFLHNIYKIWHTSFHSITIACLSQQCDIKSNNIINCLICSIQFINCKHVWLSSRQIFLMKLVSPTPLNNYSWQENSLKCVHETWAFNKATNHLLPLISFNRYQGTPLLSLSFKNYVWVFYITTLPHNKLVPADGGSCRKVGWWKGKKERVF